MPKPKGPIPALDLTTVKLKRYDNSIAYNRFDCGKTPLNRFIKNKAKKAENRFEQRVIVAQIEGQNNCIGYYALQLGSDNVPDADREKRSYIGNYMAFPAVHLAYLAVDNSCQRQGLGRFLLMDVFERVAQISDIAGFYALTLQSIDTESTVFYKSIGFTEYSEGGNQPKMMIPLQSLLQLTRRAG